MYFLAIVLVISLIFPLSLLGWDHSLLLIYKWEFRNQTDILIYGETRSLTQVFFYPKLCFFTSSDDFRVYQIDLSNSLSNKLYFLGTSGQWQNQWFLVEELKKWQTCHKWKFTFVREERKMARLKRTWGSLSGEILLYQPYIELNICIVQNYGFEEYSKRIWTHLRIMVIKIAIVSSKVNQFRWD